MMNLTQTQKKVFSNVLWALLGKFVNMIGSLFVGILVARYLGPEKYGVMNYVISFVTLFSVISNFGLSNIEVRELSKKTESKDELIGTCLCLRFFFSLFSYVLIALTLYLFKTDLYTSVLILIYAFSLFSNSFEVIRNYFTSIVKNKHVVQSEISRTIIGAIIKMGLLYYHAPLSAFVVATMFDTILVASGYIISYKSAVGSIKSWKFEKTLVPYLIKQSFPLLLSGTAVIIYQRIDQVMLGTMLNKESVGYFATAGRFLDVVLFLPGILTQTVTPILVKYYTEKSSGCYVQKAEEFISIVVWTSIILAILLTILANPIIKYTFGMNFLPAVAVLQIIAWKTVGMALSSSGGQLIIIESIQKWAVIRNVTGCLICVILNYFLIPRYGIIGSAWATVATVAMSGCISNIFIPPYHHILKIEIKALFGGWRYLLNLKSIIFQ